MTKIILITGATDGIGLATAKALAKQGHQLLLHGRNAEKLSEVQKQINDLGAQHTHIYQADLVDLMQVARLADELIQNHDHIDVLINNAGVFHVDDRRTSDGFDIRFVVNTLAPALLTQKLLPVLSADSRIVNVSSAAQQTVDIESLSSGKQLPHFQAYAQSKLALTMWSQQLAATLGTDRPVIVAVNPGSMLGTKMVKEGFGVAGDDINIGADILVRAALSEEFAQSSGTYYDNDTRKFSQPHADALDSHKTSVIFHSIKQLIAQHLS